MIRILRIALEVVGALTVLLVSAIVIFACLAAFGNARKITDRDEARFVLILAGMDESLDWKLIDSETNYHCIQLGAAMPIPPASAEWKAGPEREPLFAATLREAIHSIKRNGAECIPSLEQANSPAMRIRFWQFSVADRKTDSAQILLFDPGRRRLYYVRYQP